MCHQNPFGDDFLFYIFIQFQLLIWHLYHLTVSSKCYRLASLPFNCNCNSFLLSSASLGFFMHLIHFIADSRVIPDTPWFLSPHTQTITNCYHFCFLNMYQINPVVSTWHHLSIYCRLPIFAPISELLKCKSDHSHCPEDI